MTTSSLRAVEPSHAGRATGAFVVLVGPDGVGKSTVARALMAQHGGPSAYFHFAPPVFGRLATALPSGAAGPPKARGTTGSRFLGWLRLARSFARFWTGYLVAIRPALRRGTLVVGDRWAYGYIVQPGALRFHGPRALARAVVRLLPRPDLVVNLRAPAGVIRGRKDELTLAEIEAELAAWATLPEARLRTVDATATPDAVATAILRELR
jgi:thymidylate kinase